MLTVITTSAQAPIPQALLEGRSVYLEAPGVEREWLDHAANEFCKRRRFVFVQSRDEADLIATLATSQDHGWLSAAMCSISTCETPAVKN